MLDSGGVNDLRLRLSDAQRDAMALGPGVHAIVPATLGQPGATEALAHVYVDSRGTWLQVAHGVRGVHVNGRPVRRMAMLRAGDTVFLQGVECVLVGREPVVDARPARRPGRAAQRCVLRAVGGPLHGRCIPLDREVSIGRGACDMRIADDPAVAPTHVELCAVDGGIAALVGEAASPVAVNGHRATEALLRPGDQLVVAGQHRFVIEAPRGVQDGHAEEPTAARREPAVVQRAQARNAARRIPWLLLAAVLLAAALSALLLYGPA